MSGEEVRYLEPRLEHRPWLVALSVVLLVTLIIIVVLMSIMVGLEPLTQTPGLCIPFDVDQICSALPPGSSCFGPNSATPYYRTLFPGLGDNILGFTQGTTQERLARLVGAHTMTGKDGILVYGKRPQNQTFFSFTSYVYDVPYDGTGSSEGRFIVWASTGDSVNIDTRTPGLSPYIGFIFTPNPNMAGVIMKRFLGSWDTIANPIVFYCSFIPQDLWNPTWRYQILVRLKQSAQTQNQPIPQLSCTWYHDAATTEYITPTGIPAVPRAEIPDEFKLVTSLQDWQTRCLEKVRSAGYTVLRTYPARYPWLINFFPEGLNWGWQCVERVVGCQADTRSTIYYTTYSVEVGKDEAMVVVALNHVMTQTSFAYCNINFYNQATQSSFAAIDTGVVGETIGTIPPLALEDGMKDYYMEVPPDLYVDDNPVKVANSERCYVSKNGVGPSYRIILPAFTTVVVKKGVTPPSVSGLPMVVQTSPPEVESLVPSAQNNFGFNIVFSSI